MDQPSDVIRLVAVQRSPIRNISSSGKEGTDIANCDLVREAKHGEACNEAERVERYDRRS